MEGDNGVWMWIWTWWNIFQIIILVLKELYDKKLERTYLYLPEWTNYVYVEKCSFCCWIMEWRIQECDLCLGCIYDGWSRECGSSSRPISWHNSFHVNECVDVEHGKKSLDYRPLMNVVNQCEANSPLMSMSAKVPKHILRSANEWADVEPLARSNNQGTLMYSHDC